MKPTLFVFIDHIWAAFKGNFVDHILLCCGRSWFQAVFGTRLFVTL